MYDLYITEIFRPGDYLYTAHDMGLSSFTSAQSAPLKAIQGRVIRYSRSRSCKVIEIGTN